MYRARSALADTPFGIADGTARTLEAKSGSAIVFQRD
jgi:hypothetical protein